MAEETTQDYILVRISQSGLHRTMFSFCCKEEVGAQASHHWPACHLHRHWLLTPLNQMRSLLQNMFACYVCSASGNLFHSGDYDSYMVPQSSAGPAPAKVLLRSGHDTRHHHEQPHKERKQPMCP